MPNIICIIQARTGSTRLPNKIFLPLIGKPLLLRVIDRVLQSKLINGVVIATTIKPNDQQIVDLINGYDARVSSSRGSEEDVLDRYYQAAKAVGANIVVRVTSDNPFIDPEVIDKAINLFLSDPKLQYVSNNIGTHTFPRGLDVEVLPFTVLEELWKTTTEPIDREHVTIHIKRFPAEYHTATLLNDRDLSGYRWTVDEDADYKFATAVYEKLLPVKSEFRMRDVLKLLEKEPQLIEINKNVEQRNAKF